MCVVVRSCICCCGFGCCAGLTCVVVVVAIFLFFVLFLVSVCVFCGVCACVLFVVNVCGYSFYNNNSISNIQFFFNQSQKGSHTTKTGRARKFHKNVQRGPSKHPGLRPCLIR